MQTEENKTNDVFVLKKHESAERKYFVIHRPLGVPDDGVMVGGRGAPYSIYCFRARAIFEDGAYSLWSPYYVSEFNTGCGHRVWEEAAPLITNDDFTIAEEIDCEKKWREVSFKETARMFLLMGAPVGPLAIEASGDEKAQFEGKDWWKREAEAKRERGQARLAEIAVSDPNGRVRIAAVSNLYDQSMLATVVCRNGGTVFKAALDKIVDRDALLSIVWEKDAQYWAKNEAVRKLTNQAELARIAKEHDKHEVQIEAANLLTDKALLLEVALDGPDGVRVVALKKLEDSALFIKLACVDTSWVVRKAAVEMVTDTAVLTQVALEDESKEVRSAAVLKLTDQSVLAQIVQNDPSSKTRLAAVKMLTDTEVLGKVALGDQRGDVRSAALEKMKLCKTKM